MKKLLDSLTKELSLPRKPDPLEVVRYAAQKYFIVFCCAVFPDFIPTRFHSFLADYLQKIYENIASGIDERLTLAVPPQFGKSTMVSELFPAWIMGKKPWPIVCASYGTSLAELKSQHCRDIVDSDIYKYIFPKTRLNPDSTSKEFWQTSNHASYKAVGRGSGLTGHAAKILLADDLLADRAEASSETVRESSWSWWNSVFYTRKQSRSGIVLISTRWALDDIQGKIEKQQKENESRFGPRGLYDRWKNISFPAIPDEDIVVDGSLLCKAGNSLCPERFTLEDLTKTKNSYISTGKVSDWASLYMQTPIIAENAKFRREWFRYYEPEVLTGKQLYYTTTVDLAISQKKSADYTVIRTVAKEVDGPKWFLIDVTRGRLDPLQTIDAVFHHWKQYRSKVYIESVAYQAALQYFLVDEQRKRNEFFTIEEIKPSKLSKKEERIEGLIPLYKAGVVYHRKGQDENLELELMQFPFGNHDDECLVGNTLVSTQFGDKKIKDIKVGEKVLTPLGLSKVVASECTGIKNSLKKFGLEGTFNHKVFTWSGFMDLQNISNDVILDTLTIKNQVLWIFRKFWSLMVLNMPLWDRESIISVLPQLTKGEREPKGFMWLFGNFIQGKKYKKVGMFIIKMVILLITTLATWSIFRVSNIIKFLKIGIWKKCAKTLIKLDIWLQSGTVLLKVKDGIVNMERNVGLIESYLKRFALFVIRNTGHLFRPGLLSVIQLLADREEEVGLKKVYNLTTENGLYYANCILVSNCDALAMHLQVVRHSPREQGTDHQEGRLNWKKKKVDGEEFDPHKPFQKI